MFKIEKNIAIPAAAIGRPKGVSQYPLAQLEIGDSFAIPQDRRSGVAAMANKLAKSTGRTFTTRKVGDQVRVWRTA